MFLTSLKSFIAKISMEDFLLLIACIIIFVLFIKNKHLNNTILDNVIPPPIVAVEHKIDKKGTEYSEIKQTLYTQNEVNHMTDSLRKILRASKITGVTTEISNLNGQITTHNTITHDTIYQTISDTSKNKFLTLTYFGDLKNQIGKFTFEFVPDTATYVSSFKKHWFKPTDYSINIYHTNNYFKEAVIAGSSYTYKEPKILFTFGPTIGYDFINKKSILGIGLTYNLISIKKRK